MTRNVDRLEQERLALQRALDAGKSRAERNRLGQFATPTTLAQDMLRYATGLLDGAVAVRFLDPAIGTGSFYSALRAVVPQERIAAALGFENDPHYGLPCAALWSPEGLSLRLEDFTGAEPQARFNLLACNPPYVRHHHLEHTDKHRLRLRTQAVSGMRLSGLAGLYCHFMGLAHAWMEPGGIAAWLVPSEWMDVNYGNAVRRYLLRRVTLLQVHRFDPRDVQFADALVSSAVVSLRNTAPPEDHAVRFTWGGALASPERACEVPAAMLSRHGKWTRLPATAIGRRHAGVAPLSTFFRIRRGIATGANGYFILPESKLDTLQLPREVFTPILPGPRHLPCDEVKARRDGTPDVARRLFLLDTQLPEAQIRERYPRLGAYLAEGRARGLHERYLCRHRGPWYRQERRPPAPIVCTYLGRRHPRRARPFRFILNASRATVANVYLALYPTPLLSRALRRDPALVGRIWTLLNRLAPEELLGEGRVYGGGLYKLEPRELASVRVPELAALLSTAMQRVKPWARLRGARHRA